MAVWAPEASDIDSKDFTTQQGVELGTEVWILDIASRSWREEKSFQEALDKAEEAFFFFLYVPKHGSEAERFLFFGSVGKQTKYIDRVVEFRSDFRR